MEEVEEYPSHSYEWYQERNDLAYKVKRMLTSKNPWWFDQPEVETQIRNLVAEFWGEFLRCGKIWDEPHKYPHARSWVKSINREHGRVLNQ